MFFTRSFPKNVLKIALNKKREYEWFFHLWKPKLILRMNKSVLVNNFLVISFKNRSWLSSLYSITTPDCPFSYFWGLKFDLYFFDIVLRLTIYFLISVYRFLAVFFSGCFGLWSFWYLALSLEAKNELKACRLTPLRPLLWHGFSRLPEALSSSIWQESFLTAIFRIISISIR